jgi:hypothetical protein
LGSFKPLGWVGRDQKQRESGTCYANETLHKQTTATTSFQQQLRLTSSHTQAKTTTKATKWPAFERSSLAGRATLRQCSSTFHDSRNDVDATRRCQRNTMPRIHPSPCSSWRVLFAHPYRLLTRYFDISNHGWWPE